MAYIIKLKKGVRMFSGRTARGGVVRRLGGRVAIFSTKAQARKVLLRGYKRRKGFTPRKVLRKFTIKKV